ncbi:unnamed protein product [Spirodela intermedia]|uniref:Uncharacterized protein n=1 Tax=Spirodela intermedia TaxID=51605 RepID=A0A7I8IZ75_SPIIN|nr:unnamed protein product [Spirodela intermedia]CAA6663178.1 unnamed protein product [Spirodela intermedia]
MSSSPPEADEAPDLVCRLDSVQGMVDALSSVRWKRNQDALVEISEHGIVLIVEEAGCLQAKVYLKRELFLTYEYSAEGRPRFGLSLGLLVDCLNTFSSPGHAPSVDSVDVCIYAEIRTRIADTISWDCDFGPSRNNPLSFTIKTASLKEAIDDLEWPSSTIQILLQPEPSSVVFKGEGHGDLQIEFPYYANSDLLITFQCDRQVSYRYKYKFLRATTSNIAGSVLKDNRGSKLTFGRGGMLKIQHLVSVARPGIHHPHHSDFSGLQQSARIAYIEFYVKPEEDE